MRLTQLAVFAITLTLTGCSDMVSLHSFVNEKEVVLDEHIAGVWLGEDDMYVVRQEGKGYAIAYSEKKGSNSYKLDALMIKAGDALILDLTSAEDDAFQIPAHTPMRVWVDGPSLRMAFLDSKWLREQALAELATEEVNGRLLITSPGETVTRFLLTYGADSRAFGKPIVLRRFQ